MTPRTSHGREKENHAQAKGSAAANRGWMSEKYLPQADQVKCFFLTSPFIEPAIRAAEPAAGYTRHAKPDRRWKVSSSDQTTIAFALPLPYRRIRGNLKICFFRMQCATLSTLCRRKVGVSNSSETGDECQSGNEGVNNCVYVNDLF